MQARNHELRICRDTTNTPPCRRLITAAQGLRFLVLHELHTYRSRQGADVSMLVRQLRDACTAEQMQCVVTSATMTSEGSETDRRRGQPGHGPRHQPR